MLAALLRAVAGRAGVARSAYLEALRVLRPAEAAARRLIVALARDMDAPPPRAAQPFPEGGIPPRRRGRGRRPSFGLIDPRGGPGWCDADAEVPASPPLRDLPATVPAGRLTRRLRALEGALADLPRQARRLAARLARRTLPRPLRYGPPPGHRERATRRVDRILDDCHQLATPLVAVPP